MTTSADYTEKIPNNVSLHEDRRLQRALESWQPNFLTWGQTMGPTLPAPGVYPRTPATGGRGGGGGCGEHKGEAVWDKGPGEYRAELQRLIVIQGDPEPASVEQQRNLGA